MKADRILSLTAILIAVATMYFMNQQTMLLRQSTYASALPYLQISFTSSGSAISINVANKGLGPALIDEVNIYYQDEKFSGDPYLFYMEKRNQELSLDGLWVDRLLPGLLVPPDVTVAALGARNSEGMAQEIADMFAVLGNEGDASEPKAIIELIYASVYGERWSLRSDNTVPVKLDTP